MTRRRPPWSQSPSRAPVVGQRAPTAAVHAGRRPVRPHRDRSRRRAATSPAARRPMEHTGGILRHGRGSPRSSDPAVQRRRYRLLRRTRPAGSPCAHERRRRRGVAPRTASLPRSASGAAHRGAQPARLALPMLHPRGGSPPRFPHPSPSPGANHRFELRAVLELVVGVGQHDTLPVTGRCRVRSRRGGRWTWGSRQS